MRSLPLSIALAVLGSTVLMALLIKLTIASSWLDGLLMTGLPAALLGIVTHNLRLRAHGAFMPGMLYALISLLVYFTYKYRIGVPTDSSPYLDALVILTSDGIAIVLVSLVLIIFNQAPKLVQALRRVLDSAEFWTSAFCAAALAVILGVWYLSAQSQNPAASFGQRQLEQILSDRPGMRAALAPEHPIYQWAAGQLSNGDKGRRILWDNTEPFSGQPSEFSAYYRGYPATVRLSQSTRLSGFDAWSALIYELHNVQNSEAFTGLYEKAVSHMIARADYVNGCVKLEYESLRKTKAFLSLHPVPGADPLRDTLYGYLREAPETYEEFIAQLDKRKNNYDPRTYFGESYDSYTTTDDQSGLR